MFKTGLLHGVPKSSPDLLNESRNDRQRNFASNRIASTPLPAMLRSESSLTPTRINNMSKNFRRYSLSDDATPLYRQPDSKFNTFHNSSGNLSASKLNNSVTTYVDTKSPGLAGRIVQYNEERERTFPTHHPKYGRPGVFPIVHLFKKDLPIVKPKPTKVTVRIASSDLSKYNSPEHNRMLLERVIQSTPKSRQSSQTNSETSTRSVLDALKEISRKRIHASEEEYDVKDDSGKRIRIECLSETVDYMKKRSRDDISPKSQKSVSPVGRLKKKPCMFNEVLASESSMEIPIKENNKKRNISLSPSNPKLTKQTKLVSVETQTVVPEVTSTATEPEPIIEKQSIDSNVKDENKTKEIAKTPSPLQIFHEKPLEDMRKKRLNILFSAFSNQDTNKGMEDTTIKTNKPLISILSGPNKSPHNKHVKFNIPETTTAPVSLDASTESPVKPTLSITQTSTALQTPVISAVVSELSQAKEVNTSTSSPDVITPEKQPVSETTDSGNLLEKPSSTSIEKIAPNVFVISSPSNSSNANVSSNTVMPKSIASSNTSNSSVSIASAPSFSFGNNLQSPNMTTTPVSIELPKSLSATTSPKVGGFKFDLKKPSTSNSTSTTQSFSFGNSGKSQAATGSTSVPSFTFDNSTTQVVKTTSVPSTTPSFSFGNTKQTAQFAAPTLTNAAAITKETKPMFSFGGVQKSATSNAAQIATTTSNIFGQNLITAPITAVDFSFNPAKSTTSNKTFNTATTTTTNSFVFGTSKSSFALPTTTSNFSVTTASAPTTVEFGKSSFNNPTTTSVTVPRFGEATPPSFGTNNNNNNTTTGVTPGFGTTTTSSFGAPATSIAGFGTTTTQSFGTASNLPNFPSKPAMFSFSNNNNNGTPSNKTPPTFGSTTTSASTFGNVNTTPGFTNTNFGSSIKPTFGNANTPPTTAAASIFNAGSAPSFGSTPVTASGFSTQTTAPFSLATSTPSFTGFGNSGNTPNQLFGGGGGGGGGNTTTSAPSFGVTTSTFTFGNNNQTTSFGPTTKPIFGSTAPSPFGIPTSTVTFGTTTTPAFGANSNVFGGSTPATTNNSFTSTFGSATSANSAFGTVGNNATPAFGTPTNFGANTTGLGTPNTNNTFANSGGAFRAPTTTAAASFSAANSTFTNNLGTFGTPSDTPFGGGGGGGANAAGFGGPSSTPTFGNTATPPFNAPSANNNFASSFGSTTTFGTNKANSSFGSSSSSTSSFNNNNNNNNNGGSGFGSSAAPAATNGFNAPNTTQSGVFTFGQTAIKPAGVFSFGSNEAPKPTFNFAAQPQNGGSAPAPFGPPPPPPPTNSAFGANTSTPAFGNAANPQFGAQTTGGMFSIGSGSTPNRPRTQLRARRRT